MNAWLNYVGVGSIALSVLACGSKGSDEGDDDNGTGGTGTGGTGQGGSTSGGTSGATTGGTGGTSMAMVQNPFDADVEGWIVEYTSSGTLVDGSAAPVIDKSTVMLTHTTADGDPDPGALEANIPYETESQYVGFGINYATAIDLSGKTMSARVKLVSGLADPAEIMTTPGGAKLYAKSGTAYCYAAGLYNNVAMVGSWMTIRFDLENPDYLDPNCGTPFDPSDVLEIGVQIDTGGMTVTAEPAVVRIDTISY